jgi:hypothetical protein
VARANLWAGYANRLLGENMCQAVFDGGPPTDNEDYLTRAQDQFTTAIAVGQAAGLSDVVTAARAGRAAVRVFLGDWSGAVADAQTVPDDFVWQISYFEIGNEYQYNRIAWSSMNQPYKAHTVWGTVYEDYYLDTGDPRTPYETTTDVGTGGLDCCGVVPWYPQQKYGRTSPVNLSTGREMRLIEAEALLVQGNWESAMEIINGLRTALNHDVTGEPLEPWTVTSLDEAWTALKRERGAELWIEGRRVGDLRRWQENSIPGALDPREMVGDQSHLQGQDLCFPISRAEQDTNPNIG